MKTIRLTLILSAVLVSSAMAQYYGNRSLEKMFERTDFFFSPHYLNPFGFKGFAAATPGLFDDPMLNLQVNPAHVFVDSTGRDYVFVDFRTSPEVSQASSYGVEPLMDPYARLDMSIYPYPYYYISSRTVIEPLVSAAYLTRPLGPLLPGLFLGAAYQAVLQDERYYAVPQDIYRSTYGINFYGDRVAETSSLPVVDRSSGSDNMHHEGHFISGHAGYEFSPALSLGIRLSRASFDREGSAGSHNLWSYNPAASTSYWRNQEFREQTYGHWDVSGGVVYRPDPRWAVGLTGGLLDGDAQQTQTRVDASEHANGQVNTGSEWYFSYRNSTTSQEWKHTGQTRYGGVHVSFSPTPEKTFTLLYRYTGADVDLSLSSTIKDTSYYSNRSEYTTSDYSSESWQNLEDRRTGNGTETTDRHHFLAAMRWVLKPGLNLSMGISVDQDVRRIRTFEPVNAVNASYWTRTYNSTTSTSQGSGFDRKEVRWRLESDRSSVEIPVILDVRASDKVGFLVGFNRQMILWQVDDVTDVVIDEISRTYNGTTETRSNVIDRYTEPRERVSEIRTAFLAGLVLTPSEYFSARMMTTPVVMDHPWRESTTDWQWWIAITLHP